MSTWVSAAPVIGAGSLDGFAVGALMTGACALAITAPRRTRGRKAPSARDGALAAEEGGWLCEHVMAAEAVWTEVAAEAAVTGGPSALTAAPALTSGETPPGLASAEMAPGLPPTAKPRGLTSAASAPGLTSAASAPWLTSGASAPGLTSAPSAPGPPPDPMRTALPSEAMGTALRSETVVPELVAAAMAPGLVAVAVASALAAAPVGPVQTVDAPGLTPAAPASAAESFEASAERLAPPDESGALASRRGAAKAAASYRSRHRLGDPIQGGGSRDGAKLVFPDPQPSDRTLGSPRRTEARRMPRHAAPSVSVGSRITGFRLFAPRALATGARG
jgi:hypothetical protein